MRKYLISAMLLAMSSIVNAAFITDTVSINNDFNTFAETRSWTHNIVDDGYILGTPILSAVLSFQFLDDGGLDGQDLRRRIFCFRNCITPGNFETAIIIVDNFDFQDGGIFEVDEGILLGDVGVSGVLSLTNSGTLDVSITRISGDFFLQDVILSLEVDSLQNKVNSPHFIVLLCMGLLWVWSRSVVSKNS